MKSLRPFYLSLLLLLGPLLSYGQGGGNNACSNQIAVTSGGVTVATVNNGQSGGTYSVCPTAGAQYVFDGKSTSTAILTWYRVTGAGTAAEVATVIATTTTNVTAGTVLSIAVAPTVATTYRLESNATASCNGKDDFANFTFTPSLILTSDAPTGVCVGGTATLTAAGGTSGSTYTWTANGNTIAGQTGATLTVTPTVTTTYTVTTTTSCGTSSQQLTVPVKDVTITPSAPVVCAGQATTLTASYNGSTPTAYAWTEVGSTTVLGTSASYTATPGATTTYQVVVTTPDCNTITKQVRVAVGAPTAAISPSAATITTGCSTTLVASSNNPGATFSWSPSAGLNTIAGATVVASPAATTTYTVTATTACGTTTSQVTVTVGTATYAVTPASAATCAGGNATFTASTNITGATYAWYNTANLGVILSRAATLTVAPTATATYRVLTTIPCASTANSQNVTVTVGTGAAPTVTATVASSTIAKGGSTTLTASGAATYSWSPATGLSATTGATVTASPTVTTTYTVTGTATSGCSNTSQVTVTVQQPLPVHLVSFAATWAASGPVLAWVTAWEENNSYFEIERSLDGVAFAAVGRRAGAGTVTGPTAYQFADATLSGAGPVYYRLRQVDADGTASYSPVRTVQLPAGTGVLKAAAFPNPYESSTTVRFEALSSEPAVLTLRNALGQVVLTQRAAAATGVQEVKLTPVGALPAGLYYLTICQGSQQQVVPLSHR